MSDVSDGESGSSVDTPAVGAGWGGGDDPAPSQGEEVSACSSIVLYIHGAHIVWPCMLSPSITAMNDSTLSILHFISI
jgi:hypothetical protein